MLQWCLDCLVPVYAALFQQSIPNSYILQQVSVELTCFFSQSCSYGEANQNTVTQCMLKLWKCLTSALGFKEQMGIKFTLVVIVVCLFLTHNGGIISVGIFQEVSVQHTSWHVESKITISQVTDYSKHTNSLSMSVPHVFHYVVYLKNVWWKPLWIFGVMVVVCVRGVYTTCSK